VAIRGFAQAGGDAAAPAAPGERIEAGGAQVAAPPAPAAPYHTPFQLRSLAPVKALRVDDSFDLSNTGATDVLFLNGVYAFTPNAMALMRLGGAFNAPASGAAGTNLLNVLVGGQVVQPLGDVRLAAFLGVAAPIASGGGDTPDAANKAVNAAGILARSSMDNAMFAANDLGLVPGVSAAWVRGGFTAQLDLTLIQLQRVKGAAVQADASRTNSTVGLHLGYFVTSSFSVGGELRYQRWLSTPVAVQKDESLRQNLSAALGVRLHLKSGNLMLRPGLSYTRGLVGTMTPAAHNVLQLDVPVAF
jgi:hypothetical protein